MILLTRLDENKRTENNGVIIKEEEENRCESDECFLVFESLETYTCYIMLFA